MGDCCRFCFCCCQGSSDWGSFLPYCSCCYISLFLAFSPLLQDKIDYMFRLPTIIYKFTNIFFSARMEVEPLVNNLKIGTHDGVFHCDEVTACTLLTKYSNKFRGASIIRTRNQKLLDECDIVVDVGGKHAPPKYLDHHQRQFTLTHPNYPKIKLSSAGLVYWEFSELIPNIIETILQKSPNLPFKPINNEEIWKIVQNDVYERLILPIDGNDNGVKSSQGGKNYCIPGSIWHRVNRLNPNWWEKNVDTMERFHKAMELADQEILETVRSVFLGPIQTQDIIRKYFDARLDVHPSGSIIVIKENFPWKQSLFAIEKNQQKVGEIKFVLFPESDASGKWRVQAMPVAENSFDLRKGLKEEWRGIKDMNLLKEISGIDDIVFVHVNGFIGGAESYASALKMAVLSLGS